MHVAQEALSILTAQCDGARRLDNVGLNKIHAERYRVEVEQGIPHDFNWWATQLHIYRRQLTPVDPTLVPRLLAKADEIKDGPFQILKGNHSFYIVSVPRERKDEAKEAVLRITGKRGLIWNANIQRKWTVHKKFLPDLIASGEFFIDEDEIDTGEVEAIVEHYEKVAVQKAIDRSQMCPNVKIEELGLRSTLMEFQREGVVTLAPALSMGGALLADDMGLGKTIQSMGLALHFKMKVAVICPASATHNWVKEVFKHHDTATVHVVGDKTRHKNHVGIYGPRKASRFARIEEADFVIMSFEATKKLVEDNTDPATNKYHTMKKALQQKYVPLFNGRVCIVDEAHYSKNPGAQRTQSTLAVTRGCRRTLAMSGTAIENRKEELWTILCMIGRNQEVAFNKRDYKDMTCEQIHRKLVGGGFFVRRLKEDPSIQLQLPKKSRGEIVVEMPGKLQREYHDMLRGLTKDGDTVANKLARMTHLQTIANKAKILPMADYLQQRAEEGEFTVVSGTRTVALRELERELDKRGISNITMDGSTPKADRPGIQLGFQNGDYSVILTTIKEAIDLYRADEMLQMDLDWNPSKLNQREDRIYRIGQTKPVRIYRVCAASIAFRKVEIIASKQEVVSHILDGKHRSVTDVDLQGLVLAALEEEAKSL